MKKLIFIFLFILIGCGSESGMVVLDKVHEEQYTDSYLNLISDDGAIKVYEYCTDTDYEDYILVVECVHCPVDKRIRTYYVQEEVYNRAEIGKDIYITGVISEEDKTYTRCY
jgi:hypothetical protein